MESKIYPKISIITPSFNQGEFIQTTIDSVLDQKYPNLEYIIMDGGSTDNTIEILKKYDNQIIWESKKDNGQTDAINQGLKKATGDILAYINSDDVYRNQIFFKVINFFKNNPNSCWVYGKCRIINENDQEIRKLITIYKNLVMKKFSYNKLLCFNYINQPATFFKKNIISSCGLFDENERLDMDYEYWLRIGKKFPGFFLNEYIADFRIHTVSKTNSEYKQQLKDGVRLIEKFNSNHNIFIVLFHKIHDYLVTITYFFLKK